MSDVTSYLTGDWARIVLGVYLLAYLFAYVTDRRNRANTTATIGLVFLLVVAVVLLVLLIATLYPNGSADVLGQIERFLGDTWRSDLPFWLAIPYAATSLVAAVAVLAFSLVLVLTPVVILLYLLTVRLADVVMFLLLPTYPIAYVVEWAYHLTVHVVAPFIGRAFRAATAPFRTPPAVTQIKATLASEGADRGEQVASTLTDEARRAVGAHPRTPAWLVRYTTKRYLALAEHLDALARVANAARDYLEAEARRKRETKR